MVYTTIYNPVSYGTFMISDVFLISLNRENDDQLVDLEDVNHGFRLFRETQGCGVSALQIRSRGRVKNLVVGTFSMGFHGSSFDWPGEYMQINQS